MKTYGQFCPVAKAVEVVGDRWTFLIVRELLSGSCRFNDIHRGVPLCSPSLLSQRLRSLERAGLLERRRPGGGGPGATYHLTEAGDELRSVVELLGRWGQRWVRSSYQEGDLDAGLLMWDVRRFVPAELAGGGAVIHFRLRDVPTGKRVWWLVLEDGDSDLCLVDPGREVDLYVECDVGILTRIWMGDLAAGPAAASGALALSGRSPMVRHFPSWFGGNPLASVPPARPVR